MHPFFRDDLALVGAAVFSFGIASVILSVAAIFGQRRSDFVVVGSPAIAVKVARFERRTEGRHAVVIFDDYVSAPMLLTKGVKQGCPESGVAFILYNAPILEHANTRDNELSLGFVDDVAYLAGAPSFPRAVQQASPPDRKGRPAQVSPLPNARRDCYALPYVLPRVRANSTETYEDAIGAAYPRG
ncbi:hypothetical protein A0H81_11548 [Grifola frondosa]|uniref:Uncharacterized protein n=1 Tax=Grifola frondosa TaxID=5627 RepID=A0A1C7M015_GRIFR|nr:hypothetical protein A0H81_11548 [Grifola frondosa]